MSPSSHLKTHQELNHNQHNSIHQADFIGSGTALLLILAYPSILVGITLYKKYRIMIRHRRIEALEKLWRLTFKGNVLD
ncbi:MAG: hypothetical protein JOZ78_01955 [Chroococcidiopsidaceae cyanobacterium CP_BM_ER_R8_30]|nr:hypothetical protein [Chroococcidiopsidaceae cyanobacterium CP_BM_ER_R8_30]